MQTQNFKDILRQELESRAKVNSSYSLRAFGRDLQIDPSNLSKIISGKISPFKKTKERILLDLGFSLKETLIIIEKKKAHLKNFKTLEIEAFEYISEWHHDAILELTRLSFFKPSHKWIAKTLDISELKVKLAVERLVSLGYLEITEDKKWIDKLGDVTMHKNVNFTNHALKNRQIDILKKSEDAVRSTPVAERDHTYTMFAIDRNDIQEVKQEIKTFRRKLTQFLERGATKPNSVYQLHIGFFPLTKKYNQEQ